MADHVEPLRISPLLDHIPERERRDHFSVRMIEQCIDLDVPVYVPIPVGYVAHSNSGRSIVAKLASRVNEVQSLGTLQRYGDPLAGLFPDTELQFLRLSKDTLRTLVTSRHSTQQLFTMGGLSRQNGAERGEEISLEQTSFSMACLRPTSRDSAAKDKVARVPLNGGSSECNCHLNIAVADVYIEDSRVSTILSSARGVNTISCPHENLEKFSPGVYWMYLGARLLNDGKSAKNSEAKAWIKKNVPDGIYSAKQINTAAKFVQHKLDRFRGKPYEEAKDYKSWEKIENPFRKNYEEIFVSKGLARILLTTDWWWALQGDPTRTHAKLKAYLDDLGFHQGVEIDDLTYFIAGTISEPQLD